MSKQEATRLADALLANFESDGEGGQILDDAAAMLRRWPDGEPVAWVNGDELDNMLDDRPTMIAGKPDGWRRTPLYTAPPDQSERIAALEAALAERDRVIEIAQEMAEYLRNSSICQADTEAAEEVIRAIEEVQHAKP